MDTVQVARRVFDEIQGPGDRFDAAAAVVFAVSADGGIRVVVAHGDVYVALRLALADDAVFGEVSGLGLVTTGWAAPFDGDVPDEVPPSAHPLRRRVRLVVVVDEGLECGSVLGFADAPEDVVVDVGNAKGALADALCGAMAEVLRRRFAGGFADDREP